jgi:hypothetical protein
MSKRHPWYKKFLRSDFLIGGSAIIGIIGGYVLAIKAFGFSDPYAILAIVVLTIVAVAVILLISYLVWFRRETIRLTGNVAKLQRENENLKNCATTIHQINHCYRDVLHDVFGQTNFKDTKETIEQKALKTACEKIAEMFSLLVGEKCIATVKLTTKHEEDKYKCHTLARSESDSERDRPSIDYEIDTGKNIAFDTARRYNTRGPSCFFSADLDKDFLDGKYSNERTGWQRFYKSTIVVPIRYVDYRSVGSNHALNELGFLTIDTMVTYKLNDNFHVQYLAGFADQMYNFMSLMREKYCLMGATQKTLSL